MDNYITQQALKRALDPIFDSISALSKQIERLRVTKTPTMNVTNQTFELVKAEFDEKISSLYKQIEKLKSNISQNSISSTTNVSQEYIEKALKQINLLFSQLENISRGISLRAGRFVLNISSENKIWTGTENVVQFTPASSLIWSMTSRNIETKFPEKTTFFDMEIIEKNYNFFTWRIISFATVKRGQLEINYLWS